LPAFVGDMKTDGQEIDYKGRCFNSIKIKYNVNKKADGTVDNVKYTITTSDPKSLLCKDWFFFATRSAYHVETFFWSKTYELTFNGFSAEVSDDILFNGWDVYMFCDGYIDTFVSVFKTILMFAGGLSDDPNWPIIGSHVPQYMADANLEFLKEAMDMTMEVRANPAPIEYDPSLIHSGDFFVVMRLDGLD